MAEAEIILECIQKLPAVEEPLLCIQIETITPQHLESLPRCMKLEGWNLLQIQITLLVVGLLGRGVKISNTSCRWRNCIRLRLDWG